MIFEKPKMLLISCMAFLLNKKTGKLRITLAGYLTQIIVGPISCKIKAIGVHHFSPCCHKILYEFFLCITLRIYFRQCT